MITQKDIPTFIINLKRRPDRLEHARAQMKYLGWQYEIFEAIDTDSYIGCGKSHVAIAELAYKNNFDHVLVFEDDIFAMPYCNELWDMNINELTSLDWYMFNLAPSLHRKVNNFSKYLIDITNLPYMENLHSQAKVFGTTGLFYKKRLFEEIMKWETTPSGNPQPMAFDDYLARHIYPNFNSFSPKYPLFTQTNGYSDVNRTNDNSHYVITYNWNVYTDNKLPGTFQDISLLQHAKDNNIKFEIDL